jgi:hypothetical protein
MKSALRFANAIGSPKRRIERLVCLGDRAMKRAFSARYRRDLAESLDYGR